MSIYKTPLAELYTAFFDRAPDADGLDYWVRQLESGVMALESMARNWMQEQPEARVKYPASLSTADFIEQIYQNVLGRSADASGKSYWQDQLESSAVSREVFIAAIINGAKSNTSTQGQQDAALLANKAAAGIAFAEQRLSDTALASKVLTLVDSQADSLKAATALIKLMPTDPNQSSAMSQALSQAIDAVDSLLASHPATLGNLASFLDSVAAQAASFEPSSLLNLVSNRIEVAAVEPSLLDAPEQLASETLSFAVPITNGNDGAGSSPGDGNSLPSTPDQADTHTLFPDDGYMVIENFEPALDKFSMSPELQSVIGSFKYTGEPNTMANIGDPGYFSGQAGQAALIRETQELIIDVNGNGAYDAASDIAIQLLGVNQLEDSNFL